MLEGFLKNVNHPNRAVCDVDGDDELNISKYKKPEVKTSYF